MNGKSASRSRPGWGLIWVCAIAQAACSGGIGMGSVSGTGGAASGGHVGSSGAGGTTGGAGTSGRAGTSGAAGASSSGGSMQNPAPGTGFFIGTNFWNIDWEGQGDYFQSGVSFATTTNPWLPQFISDLAPYHVLRFMDWNQTNNSNNPQAVWSTRKQKTAAQNEPVAFEWQIDLCNRTMKDYWLNIPHEATADYWSQLAQLVYSQLDPSLRVYVEWSNEVWNTIFPQNAYAATQAKSLGLAGNNAAASYYAYEAVRMFEAFEAVFGKGSPRLVKVMSGQAASTGPCSAHVAALANATINPNGTKPDVYAVAPYMSGSSVQTVMSAIATARGWIQSDLGCAIGVPVVSYEGGADASAASSCQTVQVDPAMHDIYTSYLDAISGAGMTGPFMQYTHTGSCWGLKVATSDAVSAAPKYKGVLDWLAAHP